MPKAEPFERYTEQYEDWFEANEAAYQSELEALERLQPDPGYSLAIGVGTGRFAAPLGVTVGVDPADNMLEVAQRRGLDVASAIAEALPFADNTFETALMVTTICFVDDIPTTLREARRVLADDGAFVLGYIDKESPVGQQYQEMQDENPFYRDAVFVSTDELLAELRAAGFSEFETTQTIFTWPGDMDEPERVESGYGDGSFVGIKATV